MTLQLTKRPRRNRRSATLRALLQEHHLSLNDLVMPLFVVEGEDIAQEVASMPRIFRYSLDRLIAECKELWALGIKAVVLFPALEDALKDKYGKESLNQQGLYQRALRAVKQAVPEMLVITDVALDPYSSDGHDGVVEQGEILNDVTVEILAQMAVSQARAGADIIAPSDMMDGRVKAIRQALDEAGFTQVGILSYSVKYASAYYGPFRDALDSAPKAGDKKTYQMDSANVREAAIEVALDIEEGADMVMVKPGLAYLDVVRAVAEVSSVPVAVYNVSGEYAMLNAAARRGWLDYPKVVTESLLAFKRAGADLILTYHAKEYAQWLKQG